MGRLDRCRNVVGGRWSPVQTIRWRWALVALSSLIVVATSFTWRWFISPATTELTQVPASDALVLFVGGRGERLDTALEVLAAHQVGVLVIPNGTTPTWPQANALCDGTTDVGVEVLCPTPDPDTTRGEARAIAALAAKHDWDSVVVVSSTYHLERATSMLRRCFDGDITTVEAPPDLSLWAWGPKLVHEWAGTAQSRLLERRC